MLAKREFLIAKYEMLVTLATVSVIKLLAFFFCFLGAISDCDMGFP